MKPTIGKGIVKVINTEIPWRPAVEHGVNIGERMINLRIIGETDENDHVAQLGGLRLHSHWYLQQQHEKNN